MFEFLIYHKNYNSAIFYCVGVDNTGVNWISMMHYHVMTWQYVDDIKKYSYVIEEPPETDDIVIRRVTHMLGIRRVTIYKRKTLND